MKFRLAAFSLFEGLCHHIIEDPETCFRVFAFWIQNLLWKSRVGTVKIFYFVQWRFYLGGRTQSGSIPRSFCTGLDQFKLGCTNQFHGSTKRQKRRKALISWSAGTTTILVVGRRKNNLFKHGRWFYRFYIPPHWFLNCHAFSSTRPWPKLSLCKQILDRTNLELLIKNKKKLTWSRSLFIQTWDCFLWDDLKSPCRVGQASSTLLDSDHAAYILHMIFNCIPYSYIYVFFLCG